MVKHSNIDYYTATCTSKQAGMNWLRKWEEHKTQSLELGSKIHSLVKWGFKCVYINGLTWGVNDNGHYIMISSGFVAGLTWSRILPTAKRITRMDLQYTFKLDSNINVGELYEKWIKDNKTNRKATVMLNSYGGQTLYLGSRSSNQFGRFYNKSAEGGLKQENIYRLEVETKKPRSDVVFNTLYKDMGKCSLKEKDVRDYVCSWFTKRGLDLSLEYEKALPIKLTKIVTADEKKLIWLKTAVAPTLKDLIQRGKSQELAKALGLKSTDYQQLSMMEAGSQFDQIDTLERLQELKDAMDAE